MKEMLKVLVVDDDARMVKTFGDILMLRGMQVFCTENGEEALAKVNSDVPDCVLMDIRMPGLDGIDVLRILRSERPSLPVVLMSAHATRRDVEEARAIGACSVMIKPVDIPQLLSFLELLHTDRNIGRERLSEFLNSSMD